MQNRNGEVEICPHPSNSKPPRPLSPILDSWIDRSRARESIMRPWSLVNRIQQRRHTRYIQTRYRARDQSDPMNLQLSTYIMTLGEGVSYRSSNVTINSTEMLLRGVQPRRIAGRSVKKVTLSGSREMVGTPLLRSVLRTLTL